MPVPFLLGLRMIGLKGAIRAAGSAGDRLERNLRDKMALVVEEVAGRAVFHIRGKRATNPPYLLGRDTGRLAKHVKGFVEGGGGVVRGIVGVQALRYGRIHELGGVIRPRFKPFLAWQDDAGEWHFAKKVTIPARPFLQPALVEKRARIAEVLGEAFTSSIDTGGKD